MGLEHLYGWTFPWRDGTLSGITVLSRGELRPNVNTPYFPPPFDAPLAVVPSFNWHLLPGGVSNVFWHAVSPSNSLVVTWENSPVNRDVNCLTNFQAELFADGRFEYRYDDRTVGYSRVHPLDLDFDGLPNSIDPAPEMPLGTSAWNQSDGWAAAAFPSNAAEIASAGGYAITNTCWFTVGQNSEPTPSFSIGCQEVFFLNDADVLDGGATNRPERIRPVTLNLQAPYGTSGTFTLSAQGTAWPVMFYIDNGATNLITGTTVLPLAVTDSFTRMGTNTVYVSCPSIGTGTISATLTLSGGETLTDAVNFKCIEPLRKLVTTEKDAGRFINPSRLVMGTNAVLQVGVNGDFDATNVDWRVVSGPCRITATNEWCVTVEPTGTNEDVVVEARFNDDEIQPQFVLPVVTPRIIPVKIYVFHSFGEAYLDAGIDPIGVNSPWAESDILAMLTVANETFAQVGVTFNLIGINMIIDEPEAWNIPYGRYVRGLDDKWVWQHSDEMMGVVLRHHEPGCVRIYFVGDILSDEKIKGMATPYGVFMGRRATHKTLAHELGHVLGLNDCYAFRLIDKNRPLNNDNCISIEYADNPVEKAFFKGILGDWGEESGRGFYEASDTRRNIMQKLLMHGSVLSSAGGVAPSADERGDIPTKCVVSLRHDAKASDETFTSNVGEKAIEENDLEVYSK